jgi:hypothetical protein
MELPQYAEKSSHFCHTDMLCLTTLACGRQYRLGGMWARTTALKMQITAKDISGFDYLCPCHSSPFSEWFDSGFPILNARLHKQAF